MTIPTDSEIRDYIDQARQEFRSFRRDAGSSFALHSDEARETLWVTWFSVIGRHRDSDILSVSNFETISADMADRFSDDVEIHSFSHFAVGWVEECFVRYLDDDDQITDAGRAAEEWRSKLADYPVADEEDFGRREYEDLLETLEQCYNVPEDRSADVASLLNSCCSDDLRADDVEDVMAELGISVD